MSGHNVTLQRYQPAYQQGVIALILPIQNQEFGIAITAEQQPDLSDIAGFYQQGQGGFWLAVVDDRVVGCIGLKDIGNQQAALRKMFVAQAWRGRQYGVASALLTTLLAHARQQQVKEIFLGTTDKFLAAHRFYEKNAFSEVTREALPAAFPLMSVDSKFYRLSLFS
ncbi:GNAT family N-acetyltransferase [Erwinia sp. 9145]|uniref:GNAT family N-acetyltransferase n=1 Tax=Erwinia sp. 9145 TaxID=1500895 RepID=UPI0005570FB8|nr:GNAT family N-acetyltransferase [Erwinia sp. 9145]